MEKETKILDKLKLTLELIEQSYYNDENVICYIKKLENNNDSNVRKMFISYLHNNIVKKVLKKNDIRYLSLKLSNKYIEEKHIKINNLKFNISNFDVLFYNNIYNKNIELFKLFIQTNSDLDLWFKFLDRNELFKYLSIYLKELYLEYNNENKLDINKKINSLNYFITELYKANYIDFKDVINNKYKFNNFINCVFLSDISLNLKYENFKILKNNFSNIILGNNDKFIINYINNNKFYHNIEFFNKDYDDIFLLKNYDDEKECFDYINKLILNKKIAHNDIIFLYCNRIWKNNFLNDIISKNNIKLLSSDYKDIFYSNKINISDKLSILFKNELNEIYSNYDFLFLNASEEEIKKYLFTDEINEKLSPELFLEIIHNNKFSYELRNEILLSFVIFKKILKKYNIETNIAQKYNFLKKISCNNAKLCDNINFKYFDDKYSILEFENINNFFKNTEILKKINSIIELGNIEEFSKLYQYILNRYVDKTPAFYDLVSEKIIEYYSNGLFNNYVLDDDSIMYIDELVNIVLRNSSIYNNVLLPNYVIPIDNKLTIEVKTELKNYSDKRNKKCDKLFKDSLHKLNFYKIKNVFFNKYYSLTIEEVREFLRIFKYIDFKDQCILKQYYDKLHFIFYENDINVIEREYYNCDVFYTGLDNIDIYLEIIKVYNENLKYNLFNIYDKSNFKIKQIKIKDKYIDTFEPISNFSFLIHSTDAYGKLFNGVNNYHSAWNNDYSYYNNGISCSLITDKYLGTTHIRDVLLGFYDWNIDNKIIVAPYDLYSDNYKLNTKVRRPIQYMNLEKLIDNSRHTHNEIVLERYYNLNGKLYKIQPKYVLIFDSMSEQLKERAYKCSIDMKIPIIFINTSKLFKKNKKELDNKMVKFNRYNNITLFEEILNDYSIIKNGMREYYSLEFEKNFNIEFFKNWIDKSLKKVTDYKSYKEILKVLLNEEIKYNNTMLCTGRINYCYYSTKSYIYEYYKNNKMDFIILEFINVKRLNDILKVCDLDLYDIKFTKNDINFIRKHVKDVFNYYKDRTPKHNINHIIKVLLFTILLSKILDLSILDRKILVEGVKYHDVSRINDSMDKFHGTNSANFYLEKFGSNINERTIAFIIEYHEMIDNIDSIKYLLKKYGLQYSKKIIFLANILKDADALDRLRFPNPYATLNPKYLRLESSKLILQFADIINSIEQDLLF